MLREIQKAAKLLKSARRVLFITGAGVSAESGIPTFRGATRAFENGLTDEGIPFEDVLSGATFLRNPKLSWKYFFLLELSIRGKKPNAAHRAIAALQAAGRTVLVATQNIDGLHQIAGSRNLIELHGNLRQLICTECDYEVYRETFEGMAELPRCSRCGGILRPEDGKTLRIPEGMYVRSAQTLIKLTALTALTASRGADHADVVCQQVRACLDRSKITNQISEPIGQQWTLHPNIFRDRTHSASLGLISSDAGSKLGYTDSWSMRECLTFEKGLRPFATRERVLWDGFSLATSRGLLSSRKPPNSACRKTSPPVHSASFGILPYKVQVHSRKTFQPPQRGPGHAQGARLLGPSESLTFCCEEVDQFRLKLDGASGC